MTLNIVEIFKLQIKRNSNTQKQTYFEFDMQNL